MNVLSINEYKRNKVQEQFFGAETVIDLPVAPLAVARTKAAGDDLTKPYCMVVGEVIPYLADTPEADPEKEFVVSIAGPGDPLATPAETLLVVKAITGKYPKAKVALRTMGFGGVEVAKAFSTAGVTYIELIADGFTKEILETIYLWIRPGRKTLPLAKAVDVLAQEQKSTVNAFREHGVKVCGNITCYDTASVDHVEQGAVQLKAMGVDAVSVSVYQQEDGVGEILDGLLDQVSMHLPVVGGLPLSADMGSSEASSEAKSSCAALPKATPERPNVAVVSSGGMEVDMHLGQASKVLIYGPREDGLACLLESRDAPESGSGGSRWQQLADTLSDCFVLLAASAGESPRKILGEHGIRVMLINDAIEGCVDVLYGGGKKGKGKNKCL